MKLPHLRSTFLVAAALLSLNANAAELELQIEIPRLNVAEYHKPYVAVWLENDERRITHLALWYDFKMKDDEGSKWLKDLRQWWRKGGRELTFPVDGITSATRAPGKHRIMLRNDKSPLEKLAAGNYRLHIEAVREVGGREIVNLPVTWPPRQPTTERAKGSEELGEVILKLTP